MPVETTHWHQYLKYLIQTYHPLPNVILTKLFKQIRSIQKANSHNSLTETGFRILIETNTDEINQLFWDTLHHELKLLPIKQRHHIYQQLRHRPSLQPQAVRMCFYQEIKACSDYSNNVMRLNLTTYRQFIHQHAVVPQITHRDYFTFHNETDIFKLLQFVEWQSLKFIQPIKNQQKLK